jgi:hypothetical protein
MAIYNEQEEVLGTEVISKTIDEGAMGMITDLVQKYQYQYPIKSAVRELLSNALDAVTEKQNALKILSGAATPQDFYIERPGALYKDSKWNPAYYNPQFLSDSAQVSMIYQLGDNKRDLCIIKDYGVGLWGERLAGYFKLGYSTKRGSKSALGKYGIGAKSALSTGISNYVVESRYNGRLLRFQVFDHAYQSMIPQYNLDTNQENEFLTIHDTDGKEHKFYHIPTDEKNGLTVILECKKHNKDQYIDAVKQQMMYFNNLRLEIEETNGRRYDVEHAAEILYEDENILLSDNKYYSKPHILINRVNYGYIDFQEIELEQKYGNIGIKVAAEEVTVNPSRESVIWDDATRDVILKRYKDVVVAATRILNDSLKTPNFLDWVYNMNSIQNTDYTTRNLILSRLSEIANTKELELFYTDPMSGEQISYRSISNAVAMRKVVFQKESTRGNVINRLIRTRVNISAFSPGIPVYIKTAPGASSNKKDKYLYEKHGDFLILEHVSHAFNYAWYTAEEKNAYRAIATEKEMLALFELFENALGDCKYADLFSVYETVEVPEDGKYTDEEEDLLEAASEDAEAMTAAELRGKKETITMQLMRHPGTDRWVDFIYKPTFRDKMVPFVWNKQEIKASDIPDIDAKEVFYFNSNEQDYELAMKAVTITSYQFKLTQELSTEHPKPESINANGPYAYEYDNQHIVGYDKNIAFIRVAQNNVKYFKQFKHISTFFAERRNNIIKMSDALIKWNTARILEKNLHKCRFLQNFSSFEPAMAKEYTSLYDYMKKWYRPLTDLDKQGFKFMNPGDVDGLVDHCERIYSFQRMVSEIFNGDEAKPSNAQDLIADAAKSLFGDSQIQNAHGADLTIIYRMEALVDYCEPLSFLNSIPLLTGDYVKTDWQFTLKGSNTITMTEELEQEIRTFIQSKQ